MSRIYKLSDGTTRPFTAEEEAEADAVLAAQVAALSADTRTARQKAKDAFLALPIPVQAQFLGEWATINNALENGAKLAALARFDALSVPAELEAAKESIRTHLEAA